MRYCLTEITKEKKRHKYMPCGSMSIRHRWVRSKKLKTYLVCNFLL